MLFTLSSIVACVSVMETARLPSIEDFASESPAISEASMYSL
jgi:hypothetical protein